MTKSYYLLTTGHVDFVRLRAVLAALASVPVDMVDVAGEGVMDRNWQAAVLCTYSPTSGDIRWNLDLYFSDAVRVQPAEADAAAELARVLQVPVLYDAGLVRPSAFWLAAPDGPRTRARVFDGDDDSLVIDAVARPVELLRGVRVDVVPEVIRDTEVAHPVTDEFRARLSERGLVPQTGDDLWYATTRLAAWEGLAVRMTSDWPPDGWYPLEYYDEDRQCRDELNRAQLPAGVVQPFASALETIDEIVRANTREVAHDLTRGWWWNRVPEPEPWPPG
jgi:hypothetical protein